MERINLSAKLRDITGKKVKSIREKGELPAVLYGQGKKATNLSVNRKEFIKIYSKAGGSSLVDLAVDQKTPVKILIHQPQMDPVLDEPLHVDFYQIRMDEEITTKIPLKFIGVAPAVKELEGNLITNKEDIEVKCLPANLVPQIEVDISSLKTFENQIRIKDLKIPSTLTVLDNPEDTVALVNPPRSEEELEAMEAEAAADAEKAGIEKMEADAEAEKAAKEAEKEGEEKPEEGKKEEAKEATKPAAEAPKPDEKK